MMFERIRSFHKLLIHFGHLVFQLGNRSGRANTGDHIFPLCVGEKLTIKNFFTSGRIARKRDPGSRVVSHIAKDHCLNIDRGTQVMRYSVQVSVNNCPFIIPGSKYRFNSHKQLLHRLLRERMARAVHYQFLVVGN